MRDPKRDIHRYEALIDSLHQRLGLFPAQGLESHLFLYEERILKVYQWFIARGLTLDQELRLWENQRWLLSIYAPALEAEVIALSSDGQIVPVSAEVTCYGLLLARGEPFLESIWNTSDNTSRRQWMETIGISLAEYHLTAPEQSVDTPHNRTALFEQVEKVLAILRSFENRMPVLRVQDTFVLEAVRTLLESDQFEPLLVVKPSHGDPTLSNIILGADKSIQLIDPGPALLAGIGIQDPDRWRLDVWWDVAMLSKSVLEHGGAHMREVFLQAYFKRSCVSTSSSLLKFRYWLVLYYLMVITICLKRWDDFQSESNPFARLLDSRGITLDSYIAYFSNEVCHELDGRVEVGHMSVRNIFG
jgi:hypothetical protein